MFYTHCILSTGFYIKYTHFLQDICTRTEGCKVTSAAKVVLKVLSIIGVVLSLLGVVLTITTLLIFK